MATFSTSLTKFLRIPHPILLGPMTGTADGLLTSAVTLNGGFGILGAGYQTQDWIVPQFNLACQKLQEALGCSKDEARRKLGIGLISFYLPRTPGAFEAVLSCRPGLIFFSFGDHSAMITEVRRRDKENANSSSSSNGNKDNSSQTIIACQVQTVAEAVLQAKLGADIIVAQGSEAGGHGTGESTTFCLVPQVVTAMRNLEKSLGRRIHVVAAGGVVDGRGLASALCLGADGVVMGTRFYASKESPEPQRSKDLVLQVPEGAGTVRTRAWDILGGGIWPKKYDGRAIRNLSSDRYVGREAVFEEELERDPKRWEEIAADFAAKKKAKDFTVAALFTGAGAGAITEVQGVKEIINNTIEEADKVLRGLQPSKL